MIQPHVTCNLKILTNKRDDKIVAMCCLREFSGGEIPISPLFAISQVGHLQLKNCVFKLFYFLLETCCICATSNSAESWSEIE